MQIFARDPLNYKIARLAHVVNVKDFRMALCAPEVMDSVVAALNRLPLSLVSSEWVEQVALKFNTNAIIIPQKRLLTNMH